MEEPIMEQRTSHLSPEEQQNVATTAYSLWVAEGRPPGREVDHWLQAEAQCVARRGKMSAPASGPTATGPNFGQTQQRPAPGRQAESGGSRPPQQAPPSRSSVPEARGMSGG